MTPQLIRKPCAHAGCPRLTRGVTYCEQHTRKASAVRYQVTKEGKRFYNSKQWRVLRQHVLSSNPVCVMCGRLANEVDHIVPISMGGVPDSLDNLQSLCKPCHSKKTQKENTI